MAGLSPAPAALEWLRRGSARDALPDLPPRPEGELVWLHAGLADALAGLRHLAWRIEQARPGTHVLISAAAAEEGAMALPREPRQMRALLEHLSPDVLVWAGGNLEAGLLAPALDARRPVLVVEAREEALPRPRLWPLSGRTARLLSRTSGVHAASANAARRISALGVPAALVTVSGRLQRGAPLPAADPAECAKLAEDLAGRHPWLAVSVTDAELAAVLGAHRLAARYAPRQLLVLHPADDCVPERLHRILGDQGLKAAQWSDGTLPDDTCSVLLLSDAEELGLWLRIAPVTFHGGTMLPGLGDGPSPHAAAALGSAVLSGPEHGPHAALYRRLTAAGGARIVADAGELADALAQLRAPDRAAAMARAGWETITEGAEATDLALETIQDILDTAGSR